MYGANDRTQLKKNFKAHFSTMEQQKEESSLEYGEECSNNFKNFKNRFLDLQNHERTLRIFETPFL